MKLIVCKFLIHRGKENISFDFEPDAAILTRLRKAITLTWSKQNKCWYCLYNKSNFEEIKRTGQQNNYSLKYDLLRSGMQAHKSYQIQPFQITPQEISPKTAIVKNAKIEKAISDVNAIEIATFIRQLMLKSYSSSTIRTYSNELTQFTLVLKETQASTLDTERVKDT